MRIIVVFFLLLLSLSVKAEVMGVYNFDVVGIDGKSVSMSKYKGKVLLVVNVASECGFTPQYEGLEKLYQTYKDKGFMILGFPSNQFGKQEPLSNEKIKYFCQNNYDVHFDMFAKIDVNGAQSSHLYSFLKKKKSGFLWSESIKWNFTKFLLDREGNVIERYAPITKPKDIAQKIEQLLQE